MQRVLEIMKKFMLKSHFLYWKLKMRNWKKHELEIFEWEERQQLHQKRIFYQSWRKAFIEKRLKRRALQRFLRIIQYKYEKQYIYYFHKWKENVFNLSQLNPIVSDLKLEILRLQSELELQSNSSQTQALLVAERALNK